MSTKRCAIYTRKSTEEGLDQAYNSLDAQRDACEAFIASQKHEGWILVKKDYSDGGYSGGNIERPGLQRLLVDIKSGLVDVVIVYKIDRLTRSLADFAKMVELFDAKGVSFVSVTQQFNTTTSMGRLTLNVLLSFAQFEREVTAERIRDKISASKKKGLWMGGPPPLGYDVKERALMINETEAVTVRRIFQAYLELASISALFLWARDNGIRTKIRTNSDGSFRCGGKAFSRGNLHALLSYHAYVGEVKHAGQIYPGVHQAFMSRELWDKVQAKLATSREIRRRDALPKRSLVDRLYDETGDRLVQTYAIKSKRRYTYYISKRLYEGIDPSGWRLPAAMMEETVIKGFLHYLRNPQNVLAILCGPKWPESADAVSANQIVAGAEVLIRELDSIPSNLQLQELLPFISRIEIASGLLTFQVNRIALLHKLCVNVTATHDQGPSSQVITLSFTLKRRGVESHLILTATPEASSQLDHHLLRTVAKARIWFDELMASPKASVKAIAAREALPASEVSRQLPLAFLSPRIITGILRGEQPIDITVKRLTRLGNLPMGWDEQAQLLGFTDLRHSIVG